MTESNTLALPMFAVSNHDNLKKQIIPENIPSYKTLVSLNDKKMTLDKLKQYAKLFNLKTSGKKDILINRIKQYLFFIE